MIDATDLQRLLELHLRQLCNEVPLLEYVPSRTFDGSGIAPNGVGPGFRPRGGNEFMFQAYPEFTVAARLALPALLDEVERLRAENAAEREHCRQREEEVKAALDRAIAAETELAAVKAEVGPLLDDLAKYAENTGSEAAWDVARFARAWAARLGSKPAE